MTTLHTSSYWALCPHTHAYATPHISTPHIMSVSTMSHLVSIRPPDLLKKQTYIENHMSVMNTLTV